MPKGACQSSLPICVARVPCCWCRPLCPSPAWAVSCSINPGENEALVRYALDTYPQLALEPPVSEGASGRVSVSVR